MLAGATTQALAPVGGSGLLHRGLLDDDPGIPHGRCGRCALFVRCPPKRGQAESSWALPGRRPWRRAEGEEVLVNQPSRIGTYRNVA